jgi:hypothetical protein
VKTKDLPLWAIKLSQLKSQAKLVGLDLFHEGTAQVLFRDAGDPFGIAFLRPLTFVRDGRLVMSTFKLKDLQNDKNSLYIMGPWYATMKCFVLDVAVEFVHFVATHPEVKYLELEQSREICAQLKKKERLEPWVRQESSSSDSASQGWRSIFSKVPAAQKASSGNWLPPVLMPVRQ